MERRGDWDSRRHVPRLEADDVSKHILRVQTHLVPHAECLPLHQARTVSTTQQFHVKSASVLMFLILRRKSPASTRAMRRTESLLLRARPAFRD